MTIRLRFAFEVEFDSLKTANAYGVALGFKLGEIGRTALELSDALTPALERKPIEVTEVKSG